MAYRRKYKNTKPPGYFQGGAVPVPDSAPPPETGPVSEPPPVASSPQPAAAPAPGDDALIQALAAQRRAEEIQRGNAQQSEIERRIAEMTDLNDHKKNFLRSNPQFLDQGPMAMAMGLSYRKALDAGIPDDTPEMDRAIMEGVQREIEERRQRGVAAANEAVQAMQQPAMPRPEPTVDQAAASLDREATAHMGVMSAVDSMPMSLAESLPPATAPARRAVPVSAPASRVNHDLGTGLVREPQSSKITLTAEERDIARRSMHWLSPQEAEVEYARNKQKLARERESGRYPMPERN